MARLKELLRPGLADLWFGANDPRHLAVARVLLFGYLLIYRTGDRTPLLTFKEWAWYPIALFREWNVPVFEASTVEHMQGAFWWLALLALLGVGYRVVAPLAAVLHLYLSAIPQCFGKVNHDNTIVVAALILAFACASDAWSVDALLRQRRGREAPNRLPGAYRWPLTLLALSVCALYGAAGWTKLYKTGWEWAWSDSFQRYLLRHHFTHRPVIMLGVTLASFPLLCRVMSVVALLVEVLVPLAVLHRRAYPILLAACALMQVSIWLLFGVSFRMMTPVFLALLPWGRMIPWVEAKLRERLAQISTP